MITRKEALDALAKHPELSLVYRLIPYQTEFLIDLAQECHLFEEPKRASISALMGYADRLVGERTPYPELQAAKYGKALYDFLDWLLPDTLEQAS